MGRGENVYFLATVRREGGGLVTFAVKLEIDSEGITIYLGEVWSRAQVPID